MVNAKVFVLIFVIAAAALIAGLIFGLQGSSDSNSKSESKNDEANEENTSNPTNQKPTNKGPNTNSDPIQSDPSKENYELHALAIGDWGVTIKHHGSCCSDYDKQSNKPKYYKDFWAQSNIAHLLASSAGNMKPKPKAVIGHGDNFYWNGLGNKNDAEHRFDATFESVYNQEQLKGIPWVNVAGNHDVGGANYICGEKENQFRKCNSIQEMIEHLNRKFDVQKEYVSPNQNRWKMLDHYFKYTIESGNVTMDIFNIDTNWADSHGGTQICCQCYGYAQKSGNPDNNCKNIAPGDQYCAGGSMKMYQVCMSELKKWWDQSLEGLEKDAAASTADWKIVNSHYSPHYHMSPPKMEQWHNILSKHNIQLFMNGHTHGENHDFADFNTHFIENGAGGGIISEAAGKPSSHQKMLQSIWVARGNPYGFFELSASKEWLRTKFVTFDRKWKFAEKLENTVRGGNYVAHCWYIPKDGTRGRAC